MKVGLLTTGFPRFKGDCSGGFLLPFARALVANGHRVVVLAPEPRKRRRVPRWPGIEVRWVPYARPRGLQTTFYGSGAPDNLRLQPAKWLGAASFVASLHVTARRALADCDALVSSWCVPNGWIASNIANGRTHLCICHETEVRWLCKAPFGGSVARQIAAGATATWFLSRSLRDRFFGKAGLDPSTMGTHIGPMPIELPAPPVHPREGLRRSLGIHGFTLLFLGRLVPVKGVDQLLVALAGVPDSVSLRIAGDGPEKAALRSLAQRLQVDATFEGWVAGARKEALLRACDALVVPSRAGDGLPTVLFEAKARSLPIIATHAGAIPEHMRNDPNATLVRASDPLALTRAINALRTRYEAGKPLTA